MNVEQNYIEINRQSWNNRTDAHLKSDFYDLDGFLKGKTSLNEIELNLLGDLKGKTILHLQCHFGQDSISLSRLGADVTGVDLSDKAIESAKQIAKDTHSNAKFICCDIYDLPNHLDEKFDIVFTSYGTIGWLPDLDKWAKIISQFLKPGGQFVFVEFHPVVWMFNDDFNEIGYRYFNSGPIIETESGTFADRKADITQSSVMWNHGLSEVLNNLIRNGLEINSLDEFDYSPYDCFNKTIEIEPKKFRIEHLNDKIPMVYSIIATRKNDGDDDLPLSSALSMKVDGTEWKSALTTLSTAQHETSGMGEYFLVFIGGTRIIETSSANESDLSETMGLYINIPVSKFRNPKGTYPIVISEEKLSHAWGIFGSSTDIRDGTIYVSGDPQDRNKTVGMLEIKGFEIGKQNILGQGTDEEGYTKLSGTFHLDVYPMLEAGSKLKITDGKFNLSGAINFGW